MLAQYYCDKKPCVSGSDALALFNLTYSNIQGSTPDKADGGGIALNCSDAVPCSNLVFRDINLVSSAKKVLVPLIRDAFGTVAGTVSPPLGALPKGPPTGSLMSALQKQAATCG